MQNCLWQTNSDRDRVMDKSIYKITFAFWYMIYWYTYRRSSLFWCLKTSVERQEMLFLLSSLKSKWRCRKIIYEVEIRFLTAAMTADTTHNSMLKMITKSLTSCWDPWGPPELETAESQVSCQIKFCKKWKNTFKCMFGTNCCDWRVLTQQIWLINRGQKNIWKQNDSQRSWNALEMCMTTSAETPVPSQVCFCN